MILAVLGSCAAPARQGAAAPTRHRAGAASAPSAARIPQLIVPLGGEVDGLAAGGGCLWAFERDSGVLTRVDQRTGQVRRFPLTAWRGFPAVSAASARGVWLAGPDLIKVDPQTGRIIARPRLPRGTGGSTALVAAYGWLWVLVADRAFPPGWRVIRVNPATNRVDGISGDTPGTQLTGHTAAIQASGGKLWITGSMNLIVSLDPRTLAMHTVPTRQLSEGLVFGDGHAWALDTARFGNSVRQVRRNIPVAVIATAVPADLIDSPALPALAGPPARSEEDASPHTRPQRTSL